MKRIKFFSLSPLKQRLIFGCAAGYFLFFYLAGFCRSLQDFIFVFGIVSFVVYMFVLFGDDVMEKI